MTNAGPMGEQPTDKYDAEQLRQLRGERGGEGAVEPWPVPAEDPPVGWLRCGARAVAVVAGGSVVLGRHESCDLVLAHSAVSRRHGQVEAIEGRLRYRDLGTVNGSQLNGEPVGERDLADGDTLRIGPFEVVVRLTADSSDELPALAGEEPVLWGKLGELPLSRLLASLELSRRTGTLRVRSRGADGCLVVRDGRPLFARFEGLCDDQAVLALLRATRGRFALTDVVAAGEPTMAGSLSELIQAAGLDPLGD